MRTLRLVLMLLAALAAGAQDRQPTPLGGLTRLSLEELSAIEITSVSRKDQKTSEAPAALYVIHQEDIRRSGLTSIPELLRLVPGLIVSRIDGNKWAVSSRGFNYRFANKMLVLIDGRSVYSPLFSGVHWDVQDPMLEDIDRIEVIRGPGASTWGANAVSGVVNIVTKKASDTQGGLAVLGSGTEEQSLSGFRYGGKIGDDLYYRVSGRFFRRSPLLKADGAESHDDWAGARSGVRVDWTLSERDSLTLLGDWNNQSMGEPTLLASVDPPYVLRPDDRSHASGGSLLGLWERKVSERSGFELQVYYDRTKRQVPIARETRDTVDLEWRHHWAPFQGHEFQWGFGYRITSDNVGATPIMEVFPHRRTDQLSSVFVQHEWDAVEGKLSLISGAKLEHNDYTGLDFQPDIRLMWTPREHHNGWLAVSRAVRTPSRVEDNIFLFAESLGVVGGLPLIAVGSGDTGLKAEHLRSVEAGYRVQVAERVSVDVAGYYDYYRNLIELFPVAGPAPALRDGKPYLALPVQFQNLRKGRISGIEAAIGWDPLERWRWKFGYTHMRTKLDPNPNSGDTEGYNPRHQWQAQSYLDLPGRLQWDSTVFFVSNRGSGYGPGGGPLAPHYLRLDTRLGWTVSPSVAASVGFQNLLDDRHPESTGEYFLEPTEARRGLYGKVTWVF